MRTIGTAATVGMGVGIASGVVGFLLVRFLVEPLGPPAGVLLFTLPLVLTAVCAFVGFVFAYLYLRGKTARHDE